MNEAVSSGKSCVQWFIPKARVAHNGICCLPPSTPSPHPIDVRAKRQNVAWPWYTCTRLPILFLFLLESHQSGSSAAGTSDMVDPNKKGKNKNLSQHLINLVPA